jgi:hypothetical protein
MSFLVGNEAAYTPYILNKVINMIRLIKILYNKNVYLVYEGMDYRVEITLGQGMKYFLGWRDLKIRHERMKFFKYRAIL